MFQNITSVKAKVESSPHSYNRDCSVISQKISRAKCTCNDEGLDLTPEKAIYFDRTRRISKAGKKTMNGEDNTIHAVSPNKTTPFLS